MRIRLRLFASLREQTGLEDEWVDLPAGIQSLAELRTHLRSRGPSWADALDAKRAVRGAINQRMAGENDAISEGDEVAFFPPVTGG
jgi:molybdopterin synthase sulfur carrier subunit